MMNLINTIPDYIGWVLVGAVGVLALEMFGLLVKTVVDMIRVRLMDDNNVCQLDNPITDCDDFAPMWSEEDECLCEECAAWDEDE